MSAIVVDHLSKYYSAHQKQPGLWGSVKSLFVRRYFDVRAVDDVSFSIAPGELVGFIGPNGAGKTTTLKVLSGLLYPTAGRVSVLGYEPWKRQAEFQRQFALVMGQKNQLWWDLPAMESFILNKEIYEVPDDKFKSIIAELSEMLDVADVLNVQVRKLSLGQRMKAELIAALLHSPKMLFLDEPTIGLDVVAQKKMRDFIKGYNRKYGATVILTSHYMEDVKELCQRVVIIDHGKILFDGPLSDVVAKYADHKTIVATFDGEVTREDLAKIGQVQEFDLPKATINVARADTSKKASQLLNEFSVVDLTIEEPPIEDIIRELFSGR